MSKGNDFVKVYVRTFLLFVCMLFSAQSSWADDFMQKAANYTCMQQGMDKLRFTLPTQNDLTINEGIQEGKVYVSVNGGDQELLFDWKCDDYSELDKGYWIKAYKGGTFQLVGKATSWKTFTSGDGWVKYDLYHDDDDKDHRTTTVDWVIPYEMRGKNLKLYVWAHVNHSGAGDWHVPSASTKRLMLEWDAPEAAAVGVELSEFMLAYDQKQVGKIMAIYNFTAKSIKTAKLYYTDAGTNVKKSIDLEKKTLGYAYLPMTRPYKDVYIEADVVDNDGYSVTIKSAVVPSVSMVHVPLNFSAGLTTKGTALLSWRVDDPVQPDMDENDAFEIQRNVNGGDNSSWQSCTTVFYENGQSTYTFEDENFLDFYKGKPVAYRIRRVSTGVWSWSDGSGCATAIQNNTPILPQIVDATVARSTKWDDEGHIVNVAFKFEPNGTYDKDGNIVIGGQSHMVINSSVDWLSFRDSVEAAKGEKDIYAILNGDITIDQPVGSTSSPFRGVFNGNGHKLNVSFSDNKAPFSLVSNATIKDLTVTGSISSSSIHAGGLIAEVQKEAKVAIERCVVKTEIASLVDGDAGNGGLIGMMRMRSEATITHSSFTGSFVGEKAYGNSGFIGDAEGYCYLKLNSCLFDPASLPFNMTNCATFARHSETAWLKLDKCYYTKRYGRYETSSTAYFIIQSTNDWDLLKKMVAESDKNKAINAILAADINVYEGIGSENKPYCGTFDGNGHTIHADINTDLWAAAPFRIVGNTTIKNLRVTGSITGGRHAAGLIGSRQENANPEIHVEKVWVSANVTTTDRYLGGIIGHVGGANAYISDTRYDGKLTAPADSYGAQNSYGGAIIGWGGEGGWFFHRVYDHSTRENVYWYFFCIDSSNNLANRNWGGNAASTNTVTHNSWPNVPHHDTSDQNEVLSLMNNEEAGSWKLVDEVAAPVLSSIEFPSQGTSALAMTPTELKTALGDSQWTVVGEKVEPLPTVVYSQYVWDPRAKLQLRVNMHGENGVTHSIYDLSGNEEALQKHHFTQELMRKCVDYSFDLLLTRAKSPLKIWETEGDTLVVPVKMLDASYRFQNSDTIKSITPLTKQSSVELTWETTGGEHDYYQVLRKDKMNPEAKWDTIATNILGQYYEDKTVLVQHTYRYRVESVFQCEGTHISGIEGEGHCETTGMINGYVRLADGTALAGEKLICEPIDSTIIGKQTFTTYTDETGYFEFKGLPYQINENGVSNGKYKVHVVASGDKGSYTGPSGTGEGFVTFGQNSNWSKDFNFYLDIYYVFSGNVYYRDTSMPVLGVSFKLDGNVIHDAGGKAIVTDTQGAFSLSIPKGNHTVQAVKDGHYFANDGFLVNHNAARPEDKHLFNFSNNVTSVFWDSTTVVLRGRVVGGDIQGSKPLGQSLSKNNLGDSLKIVMQLEGDNASYLIRKQDDETVKSASYDVAFGDNDQDTTRVNVTRHTLTIRPDNKTGEYQVALHPAKYKVIEISAQGYATLFQQGKVGETVDLTFNVKGDTCEYNRIYHAVPDLEVKQLNGGSENYYGFKKYTASNNVGYSEVVNTWYKDSQGVGHYSFGYPVFMAQSPYVWTLQACEKYYKNNNINEVPDIVKLNGGKVHIKNALTTNATTSECDVPLDEEGGAQYIFTPDNATFLMENDNALKEVSFTMEYDGSYYDIKPMNGNPLKGYVMAVSQAKEGQYTVATGTPQLVDILRDPPGGGSSAYIESGSKMNCSYSLTFDASIGVSLTNKTITAGTTILNGMVAAPMGEGSFAGTIHESKSRTDFTFSAVVSYNGKWNWSYNYDVTERIQTMSGKKWVGDKADLYIGHNENIILYKGLAVRAIPEDQYQLYKTHEAGSFVTENGVTVKVPVGTMKVLAKGTDDKGKPIYLVRDEVIVAGPKVSSTFVHSQHYIENELIPGLMKLRNSLIYPMNSGLDFQALADANNKPYYESTVPTDDEKFGGANTYKMYRPTNSSLVYADSINALNTEMIIWLNYLALNEKEKLEVTPDRLVKNYDFDGAANIQYSENFSVARTDAGQIKYPLIQGQSLGDALPSLFDTFKILKDLNKIDSKTEDPNPQEAVVRDNANGGKEVVVDAGSGFSLKWNPIVAYNINGMNSQQTTFTKKIGFTLSASSKSNLNVDVYRTKKTYWDIDTSNNGLDETNHVKLDTIMFATADNLFAQHAGNTYQPNYSDWTVYSSLVYRTRGGVTCEPYEKERVTKWYNPGAVIDVATIPADRPRIWIDEPVKSNVPFDEPARFTLHMANESDYPDRASLIFNYFLLASSNPNGAKLFVDGYPVTSAGTNITLYPCMNSKTGEVVVFTKELEVYPGKEFDYNDLTLCLYDPEDPNRIVSCKFSAHFVPTAGKVNVSMPGDNWVVNTESPYDGKRQAWYLPVKIDGFDTNYRGFDHIELQYKLSTQGEKDWVSVCSYYADRELMAKASGVTDTIPSNGTIIAPFYGEADPIEQYYDIRAVNYCRHAGGFLTRSSEILRGIKDTRLPVAFGTPEPTDGILGIGDDIMVKFSEPIAGNYLRKINNFEVLGTKNSNDVSTSTSLSFTGLSFASTQSSRNLAGKSFTVDVMLNPTADAEKMTVFSHGGEERGLSLGLSADRKLTATINGQTVQSTEPVRFNNALHEVAYALDQSGDSMTIHFFDGSKAIGSKTLSGKYEGSSPLRIAYDIDGEDIYKGDMLEFRLWNRAMDGGSLDAYGKKKLTGYENGLLDYYPMNEGEGNWAYDKAPGSMDLMLAGTSWKRPVGISIALKGDKGLRLKKEKFLRSKEHDYTLMFWFRTTDKDNTLFSNGEAKRGQADQINIGIKDYNLYVRSAGFEKRNTLSVNGPTDGNWHHFAMTVSRSQNVANIYLDKRLVDSFAADSLSGINSDDDIALGATYVDKNTPTNVMTGHIDEVGMFESVLPLNLIKEYANHTPLETMSALKAYLDFGRSKKQDDEQMTLEPTGVSIKRYKDNQGKLLERRDILADDEEVKAMADRNIYAPMFSNAQLDNINYDFVANDNELYMTINEPDYMVEKTNVYVTVKEVPDLQGNLMASPLTMNVYVYRNPLRWNVKRISKEVNYGEGMTFEATVKNLSGVTQNYRLEDLPIWITASQTSGVISALDEETITFTISPYINIGTYDEQLALVGDNNMSEPLPILLRVRGCEPDWAVSDRLKQMNQTMMMVARVKIDGVVANSEEDILAVFDENQQVLGVTNIELNENGNANEALAFLTIYGYTNPDGSKPKLDFRFFKATAGSVHRVAPADGTVYTFEKDALVGSAKNPVILEDKSQQSVWWIALNKGWNWVTIPVVPTNKTVGQFLNDMTIWEAGDMITAVDGSDVQQYTCIEDKNAARGYRWGNEDQPITIKGTQMYNIYSMTDKVVYLQGEFDYRPVTVHKDWNRIGYSRILNLPISQAMSDYLDQAREGDVLKSQDAFAVASMGANGLIWKGTLQYMEAGKGYMLKRQDDSNVEFSYPVYFTDNRYSGSNTSQAPRQVSTSTTMNIVAAVEGFETEPGDRLVVYSGAERMTEATADDEQNYYLNIGSDDKSSQTLTFVIERNGESVAMTGSRISYAPNKVLGTPDQPTTISFTALDQMPHDGQWYNVGGILMGKKPTQSGVYIYNGKAVVVK